MASSAHNKCFSGFTTGSKVTESLLCEAQFEGAHRPWPWATLPAGGNTVDLLSRSAAFSQAQRPESSHGYFSRDRSPLPGANETEAGCGETSPARPSP